MNGSGKSATGYLIGAFLLLLACLFSSPLPSWAATAKVDIIHSRDQYPAGGFYPILFRIRISSSWYIHGTGEAEKRPDTHESSFSPISGDQGGANSISRSGEKKVPLCKRTGRGLFRGGSGEGRTCSRPKGLHWKTCHKGQAVFSGMFFPVVPAP